ncbi:MAG: type II secretion system protein [Cetobacterium sp.]
MRLKVDLPSTKCPVCGERKGRYRDHSVCSRKMQAAALNVNPPAPDPRPKMRITPPPPRQRGFTLVEIAIVLVIVGLLLAGIIQGSAMINSGTAKNLANELKSMPVPIYQYIDKYRASPGDDRRAESRWGSTALSAGGALLGNGRIDGPWDSETASDESYVMWSQLRRAELLAGPVLPSLGSYLPTNTQGGRAGYSSDIPIATPPPGGAMNGSMFACTGAVRGKYLAQIDSNLDDGETSSGSVQAALMSDAARPRAAVATSQVQQEQTYVVCLGF